MMPATALGLLLVTQNTGKVTWCGWKEAM